MDYEDYMFSLLGHLIFKPRTPLNKINASEIRMPISSNYQHDQGQGLLKLRIMIEMSHGNGAPPHV